MKTEKILVYRDEAHEERTKKEIEQARGAMGRLLNCWLELDLGAVVDLNDLLMRPKICYQTAVDKLTLVPETEGRFKVSKQKYLEQLELPDPGKFLDSRNEALRYTYATTPGLWKVGNGKIVMDQEMADQLINSQSIYLSDPGKIKLIKDLSKLIEMLNSVNSQLFDMGRELFNTASPITYGFLHTWCTFEGGDVRGSNMKLKLSNDFLRTLV